MAAVGMCAEALLAVLLPGRRPCSKRIEGWDLGIAAGPEMTAVAVESSDGLDGRREEVLQARRQLCQPRAGVPAAPRCRIPSSAAQCSLRTAFGVSSLGLGSRVVSSLQLDDYGRMFWSCGSRTLLQDGTSWPFAFRHTQKFCGAKLDSEEVWQELLTPM